MALFPLSLPQGAFKLQSDMSTYVGKPPRNGIDCPEVIFWLFLLLTSGDGQEELGLLEDLRFRRSKKAFLRTTGVAFHRRFGLDHK